MHKTEIDTTVPTDLITKKRKPTAAEYRKLVLQDLTECQNPFERSMVIAICGPEFRAWYPGKTLGIWA